MTIFSVLIIIFMAGAALSLIAGLVFMAKGGGINNSRKQNKMMTYRIWFQAAAIVILIFVFYLSKK